jgi:hypothetical protein
METDLKFTLALEGILLHMKTCRVEISDAECLVIMNRCGEVPSAEYRQ